MSRFVGREAQTTVGHPVAQPRPVPSNEPEAALLSILPDSLQGLHLEQVVETGRLNAAHYRAGKVLTARWRRQDPFPAIPRNDRLLEHLRRSQIALDRYAPEDDAHRLDDRGAVFIRFAKP